MKNYYELYAKFCEEHNIWFAVCANGSVDILTAFLDSGCTVDFEGYSKFGTKKAYDWLVKEYAIIVEDQKNDS